MVGGELSHGYLTSVEFYAEPILTSTQGQPSKTMRIDRFRFLVFGGLFSLIDHWKARRLPLVCPSCLEPASEATLARRRRLMREKPLRCEACGAANDIAGWRLAADYQKRGDTFPFPARN